MSKPTALAAFAAKQQRVELRDNISKPETGRPPGRNLAQLKASSLEALGDAGTGGANRGQLKELAPLRGGTDSLSSPSKPLKLLNELRAGGNGRGSPRKLVEVASTITPMLPSKLTEVDGLTATSKTELLEPRSATVITTSSPHTVKGVSLPATDSSPAQEEKPGPTDSVMSTIKPSAGNDKSDAEDVNFEDSGDEKDGLLSSKPPKKDEEVVSSLIKIRPVGVDVDDLYDCPPVCDPPSRQER
ncbi:unnamed protein product [Phytophthora lilii]|uniref:Unnamed protein product n=1 Tax=Phytophthora lilii TaxID=2077276 RepID=A0A9W6TGH3_9STRA|nr:unnamed protein product [Phytophthora lilii]